MQRTEDLLRLGKFSDDTIRNYLQELRFLFSYYSDIRPSAITYDDTLNYLIYLSKTFGCSKSKAKMATSSFGFFFRQVQNKYYKAPAILYAAHSDKLPAVMHVDEIFAVINSYKNVKHKTLIILLYSTGMRLNEIGALKIADVDGKLKRIKVVSGKGDKDRFIPISEQVLVKLREYYLEYKPTVYLFNGAGKGKRYANRTIQHILQNTLAKIGLDNKNYSVHTIRHSFATHMLDNGADIHLIQQILGHKSIMQTMKYLHLTAKRLHQAVNPYDAMMAQVANPDNQAK